MHLDFTLDPLSLAPFVVCLQLDVLPSICYSVVLKHGVGYSLQKKILEAFQLWKLANLFVDFPKYSPFLSIRLQSAFI